MRKHLGMVVLAALIVVVLLIYTVAYTVDELEDIVLIKRFGEITSVQQGRSDAGLKVKWLYPIEEVVRYDRRTFVLEDTHETIQTPDKQNLLVTLFCFWRVGDPVKFYRKNKTIPEAERNLRTVLRGIKKKVIPEHPMAHFVNTNPDEMRIRQIERELLDQLREEGRRNYGIEVTMVGIKSLGLPKKITETVIEYMKKERQQFVQIYEGQGKSTAEAIRRRAEQLARQIRTFAQLKAKDLEAEGYRRAAEQYAQFRENPRLAMFLRYLKTLRDGLKEKTQIFLDGSKIWAMRYLREGASLPPARPVVGGAASRPAPQPE